MAFGTHWEWRGFGKPSPGLLGRLTSQCRQVAADTTVTELADDYLWTPACRANVKLRDGALKLKRLQHVVSRGLELWRELESDIWPFPLSQRQTLDLCTSLGTRMTGGGHSFSIEQDLRDRLAAFDPPLTLITVRKQRSQFLFAGTHGPLLVELAEISSPVYTWSVSIESRDIGSVPDPAGEVARHEHNQVLLCRDALGLPAGLTPNNYLQMLRRWAVGANAGAG